MANVVLFTHPATPPHPKGVTVRLTFPNGEVDGYIEEIQSYYSCNYKVKALHIPYISAQYPCPVSAQTDISMIGGEGSRLLTSSNFPNLDPGTILAGSSYPDKGSAFNCIVMEEPALYTVSGQGKMGLDLSSGINPPCGADRDNNGNDDETILPQALTVIIGPGGDGDIRLIDIIMAL